jgi:hypothetical protein
MQWFSCFEDDFNDDVLTESQIDTKSKVFDQQFDCFTERTMKED